MRGKPSLDETDLPQIALSTKIKGLMKTRELFYKGNECSDIWNIFKFGRWKPDKCLLRSGLFVCEASVLVCFLIHS